MLGHLGGTAGLGVLLHPPLLMSINVGGLKVYNVLFSEWRGRNKPPGPAYLWASYVSCCFSYKYLTLFK